MIEAIEPILKGAYFQALDKAAIVAVTDEKGFITMVNQKFCELSKYPEEELIGQNHRIINSGYHPRSFFLDMWKTIATGNIWRGEVKNKAKDGSYYWVDTTIFPVKNENGKIQNYISIRIDITSIKESEIEIKRKKDMLESIDLIQSEFIKNANVSESFDEMLQAILDLTESEYGFIGEVLYKNKKPYLKTYAITNIAWNDETRQFYEKYAPEGMEFFNLETLFGKVMTSGDAVISNTPATDPRKGGLPEGHPDLNHFLGIPIKSGEKLIGMMGISNKPGGYSQDVIDELSPFLNTCVTLINATRLEEEKKRVLFQFEQQFVETKALNLSLETFTYRVSHDLKSPLTNIVGMTDIIKKELGNDIPEVVKIAIQNLENTSSKVGVIISDLLKLSRMELKEKEEKEEVCFEGIYNSVIMDFTTQIEEQGIKIKTDFDKKASCLFAHKPDMISIFQNMISNAIKYRSYERALKLEISSKKTEKGIELIFKDNGIGIKKTLQNKLFQAFERLHQDSGIEGTGIGLYMVKKMVASNKGTISVESEENKGTSFILKFKLIQRN